MNQWNKYLGRFFREEPHYEKDYERIVAQTLLEDGLEWPYDDIVRQSSISIGAANTLRPDIILNKDGQHVAVFEIKALHHTLRQHDYEQLISYMRQCEVSVGVLFGERIEVYFKELGKVGDAEKLFTVSLSIEDANWQTFAELFSFHSFSIETFKTYLQELEKSRIEKEQIEVEKAYLLSDDGKENIANAIRSMLISRGIVENVADKIMESVNINVSDKTKQSESTLPKLLPLQITTHGRRHRTGITAQGYAYGLIREIINRNPHLIYRQLYAIFKNKNYIEEVDTIKDPLRWFMNPDELVKLNDGTTIAISNQWGFNGHSKPKMNRLREIAKSYDIDTTLPYDE